MLINAAGDAGWIYVEPDQVDRDPSDVLGAPWLMTKLIEFNNITPAQAAQVIDKLRACILSGCNKGDLVEANDRFRRLLFEENSYPFGPDGDFINIKFFSDNMVELRLHTLSETSFAQL